MQIILTDAERAEVEKKILNGRAIKTLHHARIMSKREGKPIDKPEADLTADELVQSVMEYLIG